jgi:TonB family protein
MERHTKQSLSLSVLVHIGFVSIGVLFVLIEAWLERPEPVVFELVAPAASPQVQEQPLEPVPEEPLDPLDVEQPDPIKPVPDIPEPEPEPPPPPEPVKKLSYEDWARERDLPDRVQRVQKPRPKPSQPVPEIQTDVRARLEKTLSPIQLQGVDLSNIDTSDALQRYLGDLRRRIQQAFEPSGADLQAEAFFEVTAQGRIRNPRINKSSGNPAFDRSVLRTLQVATTPGPPPGNREYTFSLTFRSE